MKLKLSREVAGALARGGPVVALETSVVAQGLPAPHNLNAALACEAAVRRVGAVPAATAVIDGTLQVGLSRGEIERLASGEPGLWKVASRDLAAAVIGRRTGGTTVSATCELAAAAGVRVFATGGIGGVHRGVAEALDVSQDLWALSRFPVAVVCAGAKTVLDLPKTLEVLETVAVPVIGVGTDDFPGFYCEKTGLRLEHRVESAEEAARWVQARLEVLGQGGLVFAVPPPKETALPRALIERAISGALEDARRRKIQGKAVTPFLLSALVRATRGKSLAANLALLENNAAFAGALAAASVRSRRRRR